jgi:hypothetical protein
MPPCTLSHPTPPLRSYDLSGVSTNPVTDHYSLESLKRTLNDQLVAQYMRAAGAHYGILLLCRMTKRHWVLLNPRRKIEFPELLNLLKEECRAIMTRRPDIKGLTVIGIDATAWYKEKLVKAGESKVDGAAETSTKARTGKPKAVKCIG